ncbi:MAG: hypothetical protein HOC70_05555, partial [Gammaproteobacteria bacterium]|nr:hypothetical protein [Gammaproteobacteria bacterium]
IARLTQRDKNLGQRAQRYWTDLDRGIMTFDARHQLAAAVSRLSKDDMAAYLDEVRARLQSDYLMVYSEGQFKEE